MSFTPDEPMPDDPQFMAYLQHVTNGGTLATWVKLQTDAAVAKMTPEKAALIVREAAKIVGDQDYLKGEQLLLHVAKWLGTLNMQHETEEPRLTEKQWQIIDAIKASGTSYRASWSIAEYLKIDNNQISEGYWPGGPYRQAIVQLCEMGIIEELPDLHCRYRLVEKQEVSGC